MSNTKIPAEPIYTQTMEAPLNLNINTSNMVLHIHPKSYPTTLHILTNSANTLMHQNGMTIKRFSS